MSIEKDLQNTEDQSQKSSGRPLGSKNTRFLTAEELNKAETMYISGKSIPDIAKELGMSSCNSLYRAMKIKNWEEKRNRFFNRQTEKTLDALLSSTMAETTLMLDDLAMIRERAIDAIENNDVEPRKFSEASNSYISAIDATMKIKAEALQLSFINEIGKILREEISDQELLTKISSRFRDLFIKKKQELSGQKVLSSGGSEQ